jgi:glycosyltransferase involved in cell wall biosynthesis
LIAAGPWSDPSFRDEAREFVRSHGLGERVSFPGVVEGIEKARCLAGADLFCLPGAYPYEGQPLAIIEALASGLPVLAPDHAAIPDMVTEATGRLFPPETGPEELATLIHEMLSHPEGLREQSERARQLYLERFTLNRCLLDLARILGQEAGLSPSGEVEAVAFGQLPNPPNIA